MPKPISITVPPWLPEWVKREGITEKEAAEYLRWAFDQVHIAATIYTAVTLRKA